MCSSPCRRFPGTSAPSAAHLTVSLFLCSSEASHKAKLKTLKGCYVTQKNMKVKKRELLERTKESNTFTDEYTIDLPDIFQNANKNKIVPVARPEVTQAKPQNW